MRYFEHFTFRKTDRPRRGKHLKKYVKAIIAIELAKADTWIEDL